VTVAGRAAAGRKVYERHCASCHGHSGRGDGPVQSFLVKRPSDLTTITQRHGGKFPQELMWEVIDGRWSGDGGPHGSREMPVWGVWFKVESAEELGGAQGDEASVKRRIDNLIDYIESLQVK
jgi:mono/diheme cytochrome c family protein